MTDATQKAGAGSRGVDTPRRRWSEAQKRRIVAESYRSGDSVSVVAQRHGVNASVLFMWRRRFRKAADTGAGFVPVVVEAPEEASTAATGRMEIVLGGDVRVVVDATVHGRGVGAGACGGGGAMIPVPGRVGCGWRVVWTDMRRGMNTLALQVQEGLGRDPHGGDLFVFRGRRGDLLKILWHDGVGCRCTPSVWSGVDSRGRRRWAERCRSAPPSLATCSRGLIGATRCGPGARCGRGELRFKRRNPLSAGELPERYRLDSLWAQAARRRRRGERDRHAMQSISGVDRPSEHSITERADSLYPVGHEPPRPRRASDKDHRQRPH